MSLTGVLDLLVGTGGDPALRAALDAARADGRADLDLTAPPGIRPFALAALAARTGRPVLAVTATGREAEELATSLRDLLEPSSVVEFPAWETLPHERLSPRSDTVGRRLAVLRRLAHPDAADVEHGPVQVVVAPVRAVLQPMVAGLGELEPVALEPGDEVDLDDVVERLAAAAYTRVDLVERRGEFAVRGGIIDVFPPTDEHPLRVELWGDTVEEVRWFKVADQRSLEVAEHGMWAPPCREVLLTAEVRERAADLAVAHPGLADVLGQLAEGIVVEGMESLAPLLVDDMALLLDQLPAGTHVVLQDPERIRTRAHDLFATSKEFLEASWANAAAGAATPVDLGAAAYRSLADVRARAGELGLPWWSISPFAADEAPDDEETSVVAARGVEGYRGDTARALADVKGWLGDGYRVVMLTEGHGSAQRVVEVLAGEDIPARLDETLADCTRSRPGARVVRLPGARLRQRCAPARRPDRDRPDGAGRPLDQGDAPAAQPAAEHRRPAAAAARRLHRARAARRRPVRRDGAAHGAAGDP